LEKAEDVRSEAGLPGKLFTFTIRREGAAFDYTLSLHDALPI
jgi:hypothetical protein